MRGFSRRGAEKVYERERERDGRCFASALIRRQPTTNGLSTRPRPPLDQLARSLHCSPYDEYVRMAPGGGPFFRPSSPYRSKILRFSAVW